MTDLVSTSCGTTLKRRGAPDAADCARELVKCFCLTVEMVCPPSLLAKARVKALRIDMPCQNGQRAATINGHLEETVHNTDALKELNTTIDAAGAITAGLNRGRKRLGG